MTDLKFEISKTQAFETWFRRLADRTAKARINARLARLASGNAGDVAAIGKGASELRFHFGPGYRVYFYVDGQRIVLLCGGDKSSQRKDIEYALGLIEE